MGCSDGRTKEGGKSLNNEYPVCIMTIQLESEISALISLNKEKLLLGGKDEILLFEQENKSITPIIKEEIGIINCLTKLSNENIAVGSQDTTIRIVDINKKQILYKLEGHKSMIWDVKELKGNKLISASDDCNSKIWDLKTKKEILNLFHGHRHISSICILKNNKVLLASGINLLLFDLNTKEQLTCLDFPRINVWSIKELANGDVAIGLGNGLVYIIQVTDELIIKTKFVQGHHNNVNDIIELDNHKIVTSSDEKDLILWDINNPESMYFLEGHTDIVTSLCFISGTKFASTSRDKTLRIWE
jgi:WD40 repeat protein